MDYLGLGPDDAYDDYDASIATERPAARGAGASRRPQPRQVVDDYEDEVDDEYEVAPRPRTAARPTSARACYSSNICPCTSATR